MDTSGAFVASGSVHGQCMVSIENTTLYKVWKLVLAFDPVEGLFGSQCIGPVKTMPYF